MASIISAGTTSGTALNMSGDTSGVLQLATNGTTAALTIDASQNVGIGTSSPGTQFNVYKSTATTVNIRPQNSLGYADFGPQADGTVYGPYASPAASTQLVVGTSNSNPFTFYTNGTERMRIDSSGNVGIGTTSPTNSSGGTCINVAGTYAVFSGTTPTAGNGTTWEGRLTGRSVSARYGQINLQTDSSSNGFIQFNTATAGSDVSERMRIDSSGNLLVNQTSQTGAEKVGISFSRAGGWGLAIKNTSATSPSNATYVSFYYTSTNTGSINSTGTTTTYDSASDYRLKENIAPMTGALAKVTQLKPCTYTWKINGSAGQGFIAHELAEVVPDCVRGNKDDVNEDGSIKPQMIDTSLLVATLTAAIQELKAMNDTQAETINALTARIVAIESRGTV